MTEPTCRTGKTCYPSPQAAWHAAGILRRKRLPRGRHMAGHNRRSIHAYRCRVCSLWHVTSSRSALPHRLTRHDH